MAGKKFHFRLDAVLKLRKLRTEKAKRALAGAVAAVVEARRRLKESESHLHELLTHAAEGSLLRDLRRFSDARGEALDHVRVIELEIKDLELAESAAREQLAQDMRELKALEDLRSTQEAEFLAEEAKHERNALDEMAITGFNRKSAVAWS